MKLDTFLFSGLWLAADRLPAGQLQREPGPDLGGVLQGSAEEHERRGDRLQGVAQAQLVRDGAPAQAAQGLDAAAQIDRRHAGLR